MSFTKDFSRSNETSRRKAMKEGLGFVMAVNLVVWSGIALYLFILDRRIRKLEESAGDRGK
jgi:CcmD family protein